VEDCAVALITDAKTYGATYTPFERPEDALSLYSLIPRGVRRFFLDESVDAKGAGDTLNVQGTAALPINFAYVLTKFNLRISGDTSNLFEEEVAIQLINHIPAQGVGSEEHAAGVMLDTNKSGSDDAIVLGTIDLSNFVAPFWSTPGSVANFIMAISNSSGVAMAAGTIQSHVEFLEYDLVQAQRYWINTRIPTMHR